jgi:hypothetical protein
MITQEELVLRFAVAIAQAPDSYRKPGFTSGATERYLSNADDVMECAVQLADAFRRLEIQEPKQPEPEPEQTVTYQTEHGLRTFTQSEITQRYSGGFRSIPG